jgi:glycosyltransferase involved in cell wall biosynthesis
VHVGPDEALHPDRLSSMTIDGDRAGDRASYGSVLSAHPGSRGRSHLHSMGSQPNPTRRPAQELRCPRGPRPATGRDARPTPRQHHGARGRSACPYIPFDPRRQPHFQSCLGPRRTRDRKHFRIYSPRACLDDRLRVARKHSGRLPPVRRPRGRYVFVEAAASLEPVDNQIVLVHDYLLVMRGAERTFEAIAKGYPGAPISTLLYDPIGTEGRFGHRRVLTSFLQRVAADQHRFRSFLPLLPLAAERLPLDGARLVISSSSAFAHGIRPPVGAVHVSYCHSPFRYVWHERRRTERAMPAAVRPALSGVLGSVRRWDVRASHRVTAYVANSELTRQRIADYYDRDSTVVHPPVDVDRFTRTPAPQDYFLVVGEVTGHKNPEVALAAAERAGVKVKVVGDGPDLSRLRQRYHRATFLGRVNDDRLIELYAGCRALIVPAIEEFGMTMVEAHASGRPVVAAARGGACEIIAEGVTGALFPPGDVDALAEALREIDWEGFDVAPLRASAARFTPQEFRRRLGVAITRVLRDEGVTAVALGRHSPRAKATRPIPLSGRPLAARRAGSPSSPEPGGEQVVSMPVPPFVDVSGPQRRRRRRRELGQTSVQVPHLRDR